MISVGGILVQARARSSSTNSRIGEYGPKCNQSPIPIEPNANVERRAFAIEHVREPLGVLSRCAYQAKTADLQGNHFERDKIAARRVDIGEIHYGKIAA
ncbi:MAG: hypothetical protein ACLPSW_06345, partial [Roseiarcus sp.]